MKNQFLLGILASLFILSNANAYSLRCKIDQNGQQDETLDAFFAVVGQAGFICQDKNDNYYRLELGARGVGLAIQAYDRIEFTCPLVTLKKLNRVLDEKNGSIGLGGLREQAGVLVSENIGIYFGKGGGVCTLAGVAVGTGLSIGYSSLTVSRSGPPSLSNDEDSDGL